MFILIKRIDDKFNALSKDDKLYKLILQTSFLLGLLNLIFLDLISPQSLFCGLNLISFLICLLPWLVTLLRSIRDNPVGYSKFWTKTVQVLLWGAILTGPVLFGVVYFRYRILSLQTSLGSLFVFILLFHVSCWLSVLALIIQTWRDQWHKQLTGVIILTYYIVYIFGAYLHFKDLLDH